LLDGERDLSLRQGRLSENEGTIKDRETQIELSARERENLQKQISRAEEEIGKLLQQQERTETEIQDYEENLREHREKIAQCAEFLSGKERILLEKKAEHGQAEQAFSQGKNGLVDLLTQLAHLRNRLLDLTRRSEELSRRKEKIGREREEAELKTEETRALLANISLQLDGCRKARNQVEEEQQGKILRVKDLQSSLRPGRHPWPAERRTEPAELPAQFPVGVAEKP